MIVDKTSFHSEFYFECLVTTLPLKKEAQFVASGVVAFRSQRSHAQARSQDLEKGGLF